MDDLDKDSYDCYLKKVANLLWSSHPTAAENAIHILESLAKTKTSDNLSHLSFVHLSKVSNLNLQRDELIRSVLALAMPSINVLNSNLVLIDESGNYIDLDKVEANEQMKQGFLINPLTGDLVDKYEDYVVPVFELTEHFQEMRRGYSVINE